MKDPPNETKRKEEEKAPMEKSKKLRIQNCGDEVPGRILGKFITGALIWEMDWEERRRSREDGRGHQEGRKERQQEFAVGFVICSNHLTLVVQHLRINK